MGALSKNSGRPQRGGGGGEVWVPVYTDVRGNIESLAENREKKAWKKSPGKSGAASGSSSRSGGHAPIRFSGVARLP